MQSNEKMKKAINGLSVMNPYAAGADIGDTRHDVAINDGHGGLIVRTFGTFTSEIQEAVDWLKEEGITTIAMESTGVYYLTFYLMCEEAGIEPYLVNARHVKNVTGRKKDEYLFTLSQAYDTYIFYQKQIQECDRKIHEQLSIQVAKANAGEVPVDESKNIKKGKLRKNQFTIPLEPLLKSLTGVDLCKIPSISETSAVEFISEIGIDTKKWNSVKSFTSWLNVVPNTKITGGKIISSKMMKKKNRAGQTLRMACFCLYSNKSPIGDYYRRMSYKYGGRGASLATAHKIAKLIYIMLDKKQEFNFDLLIDSQNR